MSQGPLGAINDTVPSTTHPIHMTIQKFNRGDVAEAILGATLVAKFLQVERVRSDAPKLTHAQVDDVLDDFFSKAVMVSYTLHDISAVKGKAVLDNVRFYVNIPTPAKMLLQQRSNRSVVNDLYDSAINYVEDTWESEIIALLSNQKPDDVAIISDGVGDQKGTKADIKITVDNKPYKRQISLKVGGGEQFAQISGDEFLKQIKLWKDILGLNIAHLENEYNATIRYDKKELFSSREDVRLAALKTMIKTSVHAVYKDAAAQMKQLVSVNNKQFYENIAKLVYQGATLGDASIELVKLENRKYKNLKFSDAEFTTIYSTRLKNANIIVKVSESGDPKVQLYAESMTPANLIIQIRAKVEAASRSTKAGKTYSPYLRNLVEAGPKMFSLI